MLLKEFRETFLEHLTAFVWRQWNSLGVLGTSGPQEDWIIDPEALLVFSLEIGRYEPRLFDEILGWLHTNGELLDISRLRRIVDEKTDAEIIRLAGAVLLFMAGRKKSRKWNKVSQDFLKAFQMKAKENPLDNLMVAPLFKLKEGSPHPLVDMEKAEGAFIRFKFNRPQIRNLRPAPQVPVNAGTNIRFMLRSFFGVGAKSECALYLLTHEGGHPAEIAQAVGFHWLSVRNALKELAQSGLVLTRPKGQGRREDYWLSQKRWWQFISYDGPEAPRAQWFNWLAVYPALAQLWRAVDRLAEGKESDYIRNSQMQDSLEILAKEFSRAGLDISWMPSLSVPTDTYLQSALTMLSRMFNLPSVIASPSTTLRTGSAKQSH